LKLITRYLLREHVGPLLFAVTTLTSLLLLNYIAKKFGEFVGKGLPWTVIGEFFLLSIPFTLAMTMPMAVLIATLYAFSRMGADNEVTAMMSVGVGPGRLVRPVLLVGLTLSLVMIGFNDQVLPRANQQLSSLMSGISQKKPTLALKEQSLNEMGQSGLYMWLSQLDQSRNAMRGVMIYDLSGPDKRHTIVADSGLLAFAANRRDLILTLYDGYVQETENINPAKFQRTFFRTNMLRVVDVANQLVIDEEGGFKGDREMTVCEMQREVREAQAARDSSIRTLALVDAQRASTHKPRFGSRVGEWYCSALPKALLPRTAQAQSTQGPPPPAIRQGQAVPPQNPVPVPAESVRSLRQLKGIDAAARPQNESLEMAVQSYERRINQYDVEIQKKFALSLACLVFALLGPPIALRFPRSGIGLTIGVSLVVFAIYYVGLIAGESLANNLKASPVVSMWAANVVFGTIGVILTLRMGRRGGTARGGDGGWLRIFQRRPRIARSPA
jgi:lipopolysaccharide export system permease protein